jgi:hypothetical protein
MSNCLTRASPLLFLLGIFLITYSLLLYVYPSDIKESFTAPARATDCRCLPGYLPSNSIQSTYGGEFQHYKGAIAFVPGRSKQKHWVPQCSMCGINICSPSVYKEVDKSTWEKTQWSSTFTCNTMKQAKENSQLDGTFFCQSTSDLSKTMSCY